MPFRTLLNAGAVVACIGAATTAGALAAPSEPPAQPFDAATRTAIQGVISRQLDAFQHDDGAAAEAFAAPALKTKFPDPGQFLSMVKEHYAALIHPKSTTFGETEDSPHGPLQAMTIVAGDGTVWKAVYSFEKVDGQWLISGCGIEKDDNQQAI